MNYPIDALRKLLSSVVTLLMMTVSVAVPLMDRAEPSVELAVESEHDQSRCRHAHDHRVCSQVGASSSLASGAYEHRLGHVATQVATPVDAEGTATRTFREGPPSRAPPLA